VPFSAVLDTNVLYPFSLRDTLLRLAELDLYTPLWSARILEEMTRNLIEHSVTHEQAARIEAAMRAAFEEAEVDTAEIDRLEPAMTNHEKDRHVLAAAVAADSELIVTFDSSGFPPEACEPVGVEAIHPDEFLLDLHDLHPDAVRAAVELQAADLHPPWQLEELLRTLTTAGVPRFAATIQARL
jgi:predicted nucleic acid-binding protein